MGGQGGGHRPPQSSGGMPSGLDSFLGLGGAGMGGLQRNPNLGGPRSPHYRGSGNDMGTALLDIGLGALLATAANSGGTQGGNPTYTQTNNTFMGYRIVEDVVPLNYPVYCLGEIYKNGPDVYMGKSTGSVSQSYYFATKLEAEVIAHLQ